MARLRGIKSSVKSKGLNKARRPSMRRLEKRGSSSLSTMNLGTNQQTTTSNVNLRGGNRRGGGLRDVTNNHHDGKWKELHDNAEALMKRAKQSSSKQRDKISELQREFDEQTDSADENVLDASFDTLWDFHAKKNNILASDMASGGGDLEEEDAAMNEELKEVKEVKERKWTIDKRRMIIDTTNADSLIAPLGTMRSDGKQTARSVGGKSTARSGRSIKLDDEAAEAFQSAWSDAAAIGLHDSALDDARVEGDQSMESDSRLFGGSSGGSSSSSSRSRSRSRGSSRGGGGGHMQSKPPTLKSFEKNWERRGMPTWSNTASKGRINNEEEVEGEEEEEEEEEEVDYNGAMNVRSMGRKMNKSLLPMPQLVTSKSRTNLYRSGGGEGGGGGGGGGDGTTSNKPHYATRTKTNLAKTLKPLGGGEQKVGKDERSGVTRGSWRGGGAADPHAQAERERVLEVKRREQEMTRESARNWRKRRQTLQKEATAAAAAIKKTTGVAVVVPLPAAAAMTSTNQQQEEDVVAAPTAAPQQRKEANLFKKCQDFETKQKKQKQCWQS